MLILQVQRKTVAGLLGLVDRERRGDAVDRGLMAHLLRMFASLGIYADAFQEPFLQETQASRAAACMQLPPILPSASSPAQAT